MRVPLNHDALEQHFRPHGWSTVVRYDTVTDSQQSTTDRSGSFRHQRRLS